MARHSEVYWQGSLVGHIEVTSGANWFVWGRWMPVENESTEAFLSHAEANADADLLVDVVFNPGDKVSFALVAIRENTIQLRWPTIPSRP